MSGGSHWWAENIILISEQNNTINTMLPRPAGPDAGGQRHAPAGGAGAAVPGAGGGGRGAARPLQAQHQPRHRGPLPQQGGAAQAECLNFTNDTFM